MRIFKTRSQASEACRRGRVMVGDQVVKASREINISDHIVVRKPPVVYTYRVKGLIEKRVSAKIAMEYFEDLTSVDEINKLRIKETFFVQRERGAGRPTKKERRDLDRLKDDIDI